MGGSSTACDTNDPTFLQTLGKYNLQGSGEKGSLGPFLNLSTQSIYPLHTRLTVTSNIGNPMQQWGSPLGSVMLRRIKTSPVVDESSHIFLKQLWLVQAS